jgi:hypothetical protein
MLFSTRQSPTADRHCFGHMRTPAALKCWLCPGAQSALHVFSCPLVVDALAVHDGRARTTLSKVVAITGRYWSDAAWWPDLQCCPGWLSFFTPSPGGPSPSFGDAPDQMRLFVARLGSYDRLAGALGVLPPGFKDFIFPDPSLRGTESPHLKHDRKAVGRLLNELQLSLLRDALRVFYAYQAAVVFPETFSPLQMLCGRRISELLRSRREQACGLLPASSLSRVSVRSVRFRRGRPAVLARPARGGGADSPLRGILRPSTRSRHRAAC